MNKEQWWNEQFDRAERVAECWMLSKATGAAISIGESVMWQWVGGKWKNIVVQPWPWGGVAIVATTNCASPG